MSVTNKLTVESCRTYFSLARGAAASSIFRNLLGLVEIDVATVSGDLPASE